MTLFRNPSSASPLPLPVTPGSMPCPLWATDNARLIKLRSVINKLNVSIGFGAKIKKNVLDKGVLTSDELKVNGSGTLTLHIPSDATKKTISLPHLAELTTIFAVDYISDVISQGIAGVASPGTAYTSLRDLLFHDTAISKEGLTSMADVNAILNPNGFLYDKEHDTGRLKTISDAFTLGRYDYQGRAKQPVDVEMKNLYEKMITLLNGFVAHESQCLFQYIFTGIVPPDSVLMGVGDGSGTSGLYGGSNKALLFSTYKLNPAATILKDMPSNRNTRKFNRVGITKTNTNVLFHIYGLDLFPGGVVPTPPQALTKIKITNINPTNPSMAGSIELQVKNDGNYVFYTVGTFNTSLFTFSQNNLTIKDDSAGQFTVEIWSAQNNTGGVNYDESVISVCIVQEKNQTIPFELDSQNQYQNDEFVLRNATKFSSPGVWQIWNDTTSLANLNALIDALKTRTVSTVLRGQYIGKRARVFSTSITFSMGDLTYFNTDVYECVVPSTSATPSLSSTTPWRLKYSHYDSTLFYGKNQEVVIQDSIDPTKYHLYRSTETAITGTFDPTKWDQLPVVTQETNSTNFETALPSTPPTVYANLRYSFCNIIVTDLNVEFNIDSFVSPQLSRLDRAFAGLPTPPAVAGMPKTITQINTFNQNFTTWFLNNADSLVPGAAVPAGMAPSTRIPVYNIPLSCLRSFGFLDAIRQRIIDQATATLSGSDLLTVTTKMNDAFNNAFVRIPISRSATDPLKFTSFRRFTSTDYATYMWQL